MKTSLIIFLMFTCLLQNSVPSQKIINALKLKFPSAENIKWEKHNSHDWWVASFNLINKKATASYTLDGRWIQSTLEVTEMELLNEVKLAVKRDHPGCEILYGTIIEKFGFDTYYTVRLKCGDKEIEVAYDYQGWQLPPKIT